MKNQLAYTDNVRIRTGAVKTLLATMGSRLATSRERAGLSQDQLAALAGVSHATVSRWEDKTGPKASVGSMALAAAALGVSLDWLVTGQGSPAPAQPSEAYAAGVRDGIRQVREAAHRLEETPSAAAADLAAHAAAARSADAPATATPRPRRP